MNTPRLLVKALLAVSLLCSGVPAQAQPVDLAGSVRDHTGAATPGASVTVRGQVTRETITDANGAFVFSYLPDGEYELTVTLQGFRPVRRTVRLEPGVPAFVPVILPLSVDERVMVTAAKNGVEEDIQSVSMAVSAAGGEALSRLSIRTVEHAAPLMPSVTFTQNTTFGQLSIRGIGSNLTGAGSDPSSAIYVDGVYLARPAMAFIDLLDLDRIEALRGPQGTLYGRNAVGGALNLISKTPGNDAEVSARFSGGSDAELRAEARLSGPIKRDRIMGSVAVVRGTRDGYVRDVDHPDHPLGGDDLIAGRGQLRFVIGGNAGLLLSADLSNQRGIPLTYNKVLQVKPGFTVDNPPDLHDVRTSTLASGHVRQSGASARLTTSITPATTLTSLTAWRSLDHGYIADVDITELPLVSVEVSERQQQWSEELTVTHRRPRLRAVAGAFLFGERDQQPIRIDQAAAGLQVVLDPHVESTSAAAFGQATFEMTAVMSATAGLRYTREEKTIDNFGARYPLTSLGTPIPGSLYDYTDSIVHTAWTPKLGVDFKLGRDGLAYLSATRGFKSGGFNLSSQQPGRGFAPEWAWSYEAGYKKSIMDGRMRVAVAAFTMDYTNLQVQTPIGIGVFDIRNAASATIRGVEVEGRSRLGRGFEAGGHLTWLDAAYDQYQAVSLEGITRDVAGHHLNNAPEWAGRLAIDWNGRLTSSDALTLTLDATAQSTVFFTPFNDAIQRQDPYALLGVRAEYGPRHGRWSINAYGRNMNNAGYVMATFATSPAAFGGRPGAPRQWGVQLIVRR